MKIKYLGTAAFEGVPALMCDCAVCKTAREKGGKNIRTRHQALIDDCLLMDFGPDTFCHTLKYNIDFCNLSGCLVTHSHGDHLYTRDIVALGRGYSAHKRKVPFSFFAGESGYNKIEDLMNEYKQSGILNGQVSLSLIETGKEFIFNGYKILPLQAKHAEKTSPVIYRIETGGKSMLYAHDTGLFLEETLKALEKYPPLDYISLDCTIKNCTEKSGHLNFECAVNTFEELEKRGIINSKTIKVISHFSHNNGLTHEEQEKLAKAQGVITAFDGMEIDF